MIEATCENIWYKKKKRRFKFKRFFSVLFILLILTGIFLYYYKIICGQVINICIDYVYAYSTNAVNQAVLISLKDKITYDDLIQIEKNQNGDIVLMSTNSYKANLINKQVAENTKLVLDENLKKGVSVPIFAFSGISIISGLGKNVTIKTLSVASVLCDFESNFNSVGINQTLHSIYVVVNSKVMVEMSFRREEVFCETKVMICEAVLVGKVPETYLNGHLFSPKNI